MSDPFTATTPDGHVSITAHPWNTDERPRVIAGLRRIINSLHMAFPELLTSAPTGDTFTLNFAGDTSEPLQPDTTDAEIRAAFTELAKDDCR